MKGILIFLMLVALTATGFFIGTHAERTPNVVYAKGNDGEVYPIFYVKATVTTRYADYIEVEYDHAIYSAWIGTQSTIQNGDSIWCGFIICGGTIELVDLKER